MDITAILKEKGITKSEFANRMGIYNQNVNKMLANPTVSTLEKIADALKVPMWQLFVTRDEVLNETGKAPAGICPHCGKPITIDIKPG